LTINVTLTLVREGIPPGAPGCDGAPESQGGSPGITRLDCGGCVSLRPGVAGCQGRHECAGTRSCCYNARSRSNFCQ